MSDPTLPISEREGRAIVRNQATMSENSPIPVAMATTSDGPHESTDIRRQIEDVLANIMPRHIEFLLTSLRRDLQIETNHMTPLQSQSSSTSTSIQPNPGTRDVPYDSDSIRQPYEVVSNIHGSSSPSVSAAGYGDRPSMMSGNISDNAHLQQVHSRAYRQTPHGVEKSVRAMVEKSKISGNNGDLLRRIDSFHASLNSTNLLKLLKGTRPVPIQTAENPNGYSPRRTGILNDPQSMVEEDDAYFYLHDSKRLFHLVICLFDSSVHYHCPEEIKNENGI